MTLTIDASVFVSVYVVDDAHYAVSDAFVHRVDADAVDIACPSILVAECACAVARRTSNSSLGQAAANDILSIPTVRLVAVDTDRARTAANLGSNLRLRGADSVYVAVAAEADATLITWDNELLSRGPIAVPTMTPADWLAANPLLPPTT